MMTRWPSPRESGDVSFASPRSERSTEGYCRGLLICVTTRSSTGSPTHGARRSSPIEVGMADGAPATVGGREHLVIRREEPVAEVRVLNPGAGTYQPKVYVMLGPRYRR